MNHRLNKLRSEINTVEMRAKVLSAFYKEIEIILLMNVPSLVEAVFENERWIIKHTIHGHTQRYAAVDAIGQPVDSIQGWVFEEIPPRYTVEPGRAIYRDGQPLFDLELLKSPSGKWNPHHLDVFTRRLVKALNEGILKYPEATDGTLEE